jgi:hypothetical protein
MPNLSAVTVHTMASAAQHEGAMISDRTEKAPLLKNEPDKLY